MSGKMSVTIEMEFNDPTLTREDAKRFIVAAIGIRIAVLRDDTTQADELHIAEPDHIVGAIKTWRAT